ncbi:dTMP kinase [Psychrobacillus lasiicapitis]|uniref:Thymidylate kinase n=1 Tax=Psychrobacillus lasiicapitis TaxID=1636719 RepID=A0A544SSR9_9BACI|nr:dTMP kinase [Psychrobacillus lasiicapitis]TQR08260.1 dTMP kinase [Psychrobacillus lasiicapitis]GGA48729.1 thymidylate kinase [Psychrobacillus lasiicapitis]
MQKRGYFITSEGPEGAGKTTVMNLLGDKLKEEGYDVVMTREPGGIMISEKIRNIILDNEHIMMESRTEALLYAAARRQHLVEKVQPAIDAGKIVICDRFIDSSLAYQGFARGIGVQEILAINKFAIGDTMPDKTILFDIEPSVGLARINAHKNREKNRLDVESLMFHEKVREGYLSLADQYPERIEVIDASCSVETVLEEVYKVIKSQLEIIR